MPAARNPSGTRLVTPQSRNDDTGNVANCRRLARETRILAAIRSANRDTERGARADR
jgi:hypothetical protein